MMKSVSLVVALSIAALSTFTLEAQQLPAWQEGYLDIHSIATGKGDATFVIMPDGTKMLIDAGDMTNSRFICPAYPSDSLTPAQWIARYIKRFSEGTSGKTDEVDYFSLTHFHSDHMGNIKAMKPGPDYGKCGIMELADYIHFGKFVDRAYPGYDFPSEKNVDKANAIMGEYKKFINWQKNSNGAVVEGFKVGCRKQFALKYNQSKYKDLFDVRNIAGGGYIVKGKSVKPMFKSDPAKLDENMFSTVLLFTYGKFTYYNGGDLGGGIHGAYSEHRDFESQVADVIGQVTTMKANHHAWKEVLNPYFLWKLRPQAIVVLCSHINHPWKETVQRLLDPLMPVRPEIYVTTDSGRDQVGEELFRNIKTPGHIVFRVYEGGTAYQIFVLDARSLDYKVIYQSERRDL